MPNTCSSYRLLDMRIGTTALKHAPCILGLSGKDSPFSPSAIQASLQTSTVQARNGTNGVEMTLIKRCDVKAYNAARKQKSLHQIQADGRASITGLRTADLSIEANVPVFVDDFSLEHSSPGGTTDRKSTRLNSSHANIS